MMNRLDSVLFCPQLGSSMNHIQGWMTVRRSYSCALEQGRLAWRRRRRGRRRGRRGRHLAFAARLKRQLQRRRRRRQHSASRRRSSSARFRPHHKDPTAKSVPFVRSKWLSQNERNLLITNLDILTSSITQAEQYLACRNLSC